MACWVSLLATRPEPTGRRNAPTTCSCCGCACSSNCDMRVSIDGRMCLAPCIHAHARWHVTLLASWLTAAGPPMIGPCVVKWARPLWKAFPRCPADEYPHTIFSTARHILSGNFTYQSTPLYTTTSQHPHTPITMADTNPNDAQVSPVHVHPASSFAPSP